MKKISNPFLVSSFIFVALFLVGVLISVFLVRNRLDNQFNGSKYELLLRSYEADVAVKNSNFNILIITLKNPNLENQENISFQLFEGNKIIRELQFSGSNVGDPSDVRLQFAPIPDSGEKSYLIKLETTESKKPISIYTADNGRLAYKSYFRSTNKPLALKNFTTSFIARLFLDMTFLALWIVIATSAVVISKKLN